MKQEDLDRVVSWFWWTEPERILRTAYGESAHDSYIREKMQILRQNPLYWYGQLDRTNQQKILDAIFA